MGSVCVRWDRVEGGDGCSVKGVGRGGEKGTEVCNVWGEMEILYGIKANFTLLHSGNFTASLLPTLLLSDSCMLNHPHLTLFTVD